jgi:mono/diheme cytochrome c family protein
MAAICSVKSAPMNSTGRHRPKIGIAPLLGRLVLGFCPAARAVDGAKVFANNCGAGHGSDGNARNPAARKLGVNDLTVSTRTDAQIEKQVKEGARNKSGVQVMPSFKDTRSPAEIQAVIAAVKAPRQ